jgi:DNA-binding GntR family transcriptional regulator
MDAPAAIALIRSTSLATLAEGEVTRMIRSGTLAPGQQVKEADMARQLGVGRTAVREALRALEAAGMVRIEKNRGAFVRVLGETEAREAYFVRGEIEAIAGALLAPRITPAQLDALRRAADGGLGAPDLGFHRSLVEMAGNTRLAAIHRRLADELSLARAAGPAAGRARADADAEHGRILEALAARDPVAAGAALREHAAAADLRRRDAIAAAGGFRRD